MSVMDRETLRASNGHIKKKKRRNTHIDGHRAMLSSQIFRFSPACGLFWTENCFTLSSIFFCRWLFVRTWFMDRSRVSIFKWYTHSKIQLTFSSRHIAPHELNMASLNHFHRFRPLFAVKRSSCTGAWPATNSKLFRVTTFGCHRLCETGICYWVLSTSHIPYLACTGFLSIEKEYFPCSPNISIFSNGFSDMMISSAIFQLNVHIGRCVVSTFALLSSLNFSHHPWNAKFLINSPYGFGEMSTNFFRLCLCPERYGAMLGINFMN